MASRLAAEGYLKRLFPEKSAPDLLTTGGGMPYYFVKWLVASVVEASILAFKDTV